MELWLKWNKIVDQRKFKTIFGVKKVIFNKRQVDPDKESESRNPTLDAKTMLFCK